MIAQGTLLWLLTAAGVATAWGTRSITDGSALGGVIGQGFALVLWALVAIHATGYRQLTGGDAIVVSHLSITVLGAIGAVVTVLLLFDAVSRLST